jgi:hypothetical protein
VPVDIANLKGLRKADHCRSSFARKAERSAGTGLTGVLMTFHKNLKRPRSCSPGKAFDLIRGRQSLAPLDVPVYLAPNWETSQR